MFLFSIISILYLCIKTHNLIEQITFIVLSDWFIDWLINWLIDRLIDWLIRPNAARICVCSDECVQYGSATAKVDSKSNALYCCVHHRYTLSKQFTTLASSEALSSWLLLIISKLPINFKTWANYPSVWGLINTTQFIWTKGYLDCIEGLGWVCMVRWRTRVDPMMSIPADP